jgi:hypothetical protein
LNRLQTDCSVFTLDVDIEHYQYLAFEEEPFPLERLLDGSPKLHNWTVPSVYTPEPFLSRPKLWYLSGEAGFVLTSEQIELWSPLLKEVELLPISFTQADSLFLVNILRVCDDAVDEANTNVKAYPWQLAFNEQNLPSPGFFKVGVTAAAQVLYRAEPEADWLISLAENGQIDGFNLRCIWTS